VGFTVGYLVNTVGTLITAPASLNIGGTIGGAVAVAIMAVIIGALIANSNKKIKAEYALK
jgi:ferrous iron transport protein B